MAVSNDSVESDLMQVGRLKLEHLKDGLSVDLDWIALDLQIDCGSCSTYDVSSGADILRSAIGSTESRVDQLLAELVQEVKHLQVGA